ncbi:hypothetical protein A7D00_7144 [Trichophyton violaceum]|uniref:Uncharacterized protein n=1 Tax=Trichophyton violaceum TaxID=34388 RepID=A0A178F959_TRIVO|nr:hypothetical protein A7D00_7144 [Trichophyton violaceum]
MAYPSTCCDGRETGMAREFVDRPSEIVNRSITPLEILDLTSFKSFMVKGVIEAADCHHLIPRIMAMISINRQMSGLTVDVEVTDGQTKNRRQFLEIRVIPLLFERQQPQRAGVCQGGVLGSAILKAKNVGKQDTVISQGIEGEDLKALEGPAGAAKARHAENKRKREEIETAKKRETAENSRI